MTFEPTAHQLAFVLPASFLKADILFRRVTNGTDEIRIPIIPAEKPRYVVSTARLAKGLWRVYLAWSDGRGQYHDEQQIQVH